MNPLNPIELSVIDEHTTVVVPQTLRLDKETSEQPFCVVTEDSDNPGQCHVFEGRLFVKGWTALAEDAREERARVILEGFGQDAARYEEALRKQLSSLRFCQVGFGKIHTNHHVCHLPLDQTLQNVRRSNICRIVISTLHNPWEIGLLIGTGRLINKTDGDHQTQHL